MVILLLSARGGGKSAASLSWRTRIFERRNDDNLCATY
jgi:hypothetical protein